MLKYKIAFFSIAVLSLLISLPMAYADIASKSYVDQEVGKRLSSITAETAGVGNVVTSVSASDGTVTINKDITAEETSNKVAIIRDSAAATDIAYPSEKAVATALEGKADSADLSDLATKAELENYATTESLATVATTGSYNDLTNKPNIPEGVEVDTALTASGENPVQGKVIYEALAGKQAVGDYATNTALSSVQATAESAQSDATDAMEAVDSKVAKSQGSSAANKVLITDGSGNVTTGTVSSAMITDGAITNADISSSAAISQSKISGLTSALAAKADSEDLATVATTGSYNDLSDKPVIPEGVVVDEVITAEGVNPVQGKAVYEALAGKQPVGDYATNTALSSVQATAESAQSDATDAMEAVDSKVAKSQGSSAANKVLITDGSGNVTTGTVSSAMITDGAITNADISSSAAISQSKISGLTTALAGKANTEDLAEVATTGSYNDLTDKPSIPAAITVDAALSSTSTNPVQNKVINTALAGKLSTTGTAAKATADANGNSIVDTYATKTQLSSYVTTTTLNGLDSTSSGTGAVVTGVSQTNGKVAVTKGNVKIPVGSESATTYATIWIE